MQVTYEAKDYSPEKVSGRYARASTVGVEYFWCEVGPRGYDIRQGYADATELPEDVRKKADALSGHWPPYVRWPN